MINDLTKYLKNKLIVSCQAKHGEYLREPETLLRIAKTCVDSGSVAIRCEGIDNIKLFKKELIVPLIGLLKSKFEDGSVKITGSEKEVFVLHKLNVDIIAIDGTNRIRERKTGPEFINNVKNKYNIKVMADISTLQEAINCEKAGADFISTTLSGYTPHTLNYYNDYPDLNLLCSLIDIIKKPVIAEGRYNSPLLTSLAFKLGAWSVIVGTAITRPGIITKWFIPKF